MTDPRVQQLTDFFGPDEPLDEELQAYVQRTGPLGPMVKHPRVFGPASTPGYLNRMLKQKKEQLERAEREGRWDTYLVLHERPWRIPTLARLVAEQRLTRGQLQDLLLDTWMDTELPHQFRGTPLELFTRAGFVTDNQVAWNALSAPLILYRGDSRRPRATSLSWTLSEEKAKWFAKRWERQAHPGVVWRAHLLDKSKALAFVEGRNELEVVVSPKNLKWLQQLD